MKVFLIKAINIAVLCGVLYAYQDNAMARQNELEKFNEQQNAARLEWAMSQNVQSGENGNQASQIYNDGTYQGTGTGFGGDVTVEVQIMSDVIVSAKVISADNETPDYLASAEKLLDDVITCQSADVDTISGATFSSNGILEGLNNALEDAKK